jgi:hypothetical protein
VDRGLNMNENKYRFPEMVVANYVSKNKVRQMINNKYKKGNFNIKSPAEMEKLVEVAENVFNNMEDPGGALNTVTADRTRDFSKKLYDIANNVTPDQYKAILKQNRAAESAIEEESEDETAEAIEQEMREDDILRNFI